MRGRRSLCLTLVLCLGLSGSLALTGCDDSSSKTEATPTMTEAQKAEFAARQKETEEANKLQQKTKKNTLPRGSIPGAKTS